MKPDVHDQALVSLHCGLRAGEVFALTWADVDMERGVLTLRDTTSGRPRAASMTGAVTNMLAQRRRHARAERVFPPEPRARIGQISQTFAYKSGGTDRERWLCLHDGKPTRIVLAKEAVYIEGARVQVCGGIQPGIFGKVFGGENG